MKILSNEKWDAIQQELMKIYALGMGNVAIPQGFWLSSAKRMCDAGVLNMTVKESPADQEDDYE